LCTAVIRKTLRTDSMKIRDSGMPDPKTWESFFEPTPVLRQLAIADSTPCRAMIPRDVGPVFHGMPGHRSTASRAG